MFRKSLFQHSNPWPKLKIVGSADEKMNVIGHDHVSTNGNVRREFACDANATNAPRTASDTSNFLRSCVQKVTKNRGL
jgi:hypothetical protein